MSTPTWLLHFAKTLLSPIRQQAAKLFTFALLSAALAHSQGPGQVLTGYFPEWGPANGFTPNNLDPYVVSRLNYLIYAFANIYGNSCELTDSNQEPTTFQQLKTLKANNPNLKILLSVGGQNSDGPLSAATANGNASNFASSCISNFFTAYPGVFDGVDIDWEYPTSADTASFTALVQAFHTKLPNAILTAAIGVTPGQYGNIQFSAVNRLINYFSVMGYDVAASTVTTFNAPLYNSYLTGGQDTWNGTVDAAMTDLTNPKGSYKIPANQLLLGIPFYGMRWTSVPNGSFPDGTSSNGFYQSVAGSATQVPYSTIATLSGTKHCDFAGTENQSCTQPLSLPTSGAQEVWIYDGSSFTSFDDPVSMSTKVQYARAKQLGGITVWELSQDLSQDKKHELLMDSIVSDMGSASQGAWTGEYGEDGYLIANGGSNLPGYASVALTGDATYTWAASTSDVRALQTSTGASTRIASTYYSGTNFTINVNLTDGNTHRIALYLLDWDTTSRSETISIRDAVTNTVLDAETFSGFHNGEYAAWNLRGHVLIQVTKTGGGNAVVSGIFFGSAPSSSAVATYSGVDATTKGTWSGKYGMNGDLIANGVLAPPTFASVSLTGDTPYTWAASTSDVRALQTSNGAPSRIASTYYSSTNFTINLNLTDGNTHRIALYLLDWDTSSRSETISILDAVSNTVLNTQTFSGFHNGEYAAWNVQGHVLIQVIRTGGGNGVVSGIFFD